MTSDLNYPDTLPLLPLKELVIYPTMIIPFVVGRERSISAVLDVDPANKLIFTSCQKIAEEDHPTPDSIYHTGTICKVLQMIRLKDGTFKVLVEGLERATITQYVDHTSHLSVHYQVKKSIEDTDGEHSAYVKIIKEEFERYLEFNPQLSHERGASVNNLQNLGHITDIIASVITVETAEKQKILEFFNVNNRFEYLYKLMDNEIELQGIEQKLKERVKKQIDTTQKEFFLNEQLKAIHKELGKAKGLDELEEMQEKLKSLRLAKELETRIMKDITRLEQMPSASPEVTVIRNYLDWILELPWKKRSRDKMNIAEAERILDKNHAGLDEVKERIVEYLAVCKLSKKIKGPILCLSGPPGVGKTSLGKSIAEALGRKFIKISLGGLKDEAEIRGHRRTYVGSMPGKIIQGMKKAGVKNPVIMLDEIDKMSNDFRGDPSAAMLEVLDPEQNATFNDHYLEVDFDLSEVMFVCTANVTHTIPAPLLDRMEILSIAGYTDEEKLDIVNNFIIPKQLAENGLNKNNIKLQDKQVKTVISQYTREAGLRNVNREISKIFRKVAKKVVIDRKTKITIDDKNLKEYLGSPKYKVKLKEMKPEIGITQGLAWTQSGGDILITEVTVLDGTGKLTLTGKLGDVMKESAQAALTYVRSRAKKLGLAKDFYEKCDIHIHVPEGAIPKDGPSAGITMATAMVSALTKLPVENDLAMTGEITLNGKVLPIGGLKEKSLAAYRAGISTIIIPKDNEKDLENVPDTVKKHIKFIPLENVDDVLKQAIKGIYKKK